MQAKKYSTLYGNKELVIETGKLAKQALASAFVTYGDTQILATVVKSKTARDGINYFPLMVDYEERLYASGKIKGSRFIKREGRPTDEAVLNARMVDRAIRPLFNEECREDIQVILTVLSMDQENFPDIVSLIAASSALCMSGLDWKGPIAGARIGEKEGNFVFNPSSEILKESKLDLTIAGTSDKIIMIEAGAKEANEEEMIKAIKFGQQNFTPLIKLLQEIKDATTPIPAPTKELTEEDKLKNEIKEKAQNWLNKNINSYLFNEIKKTKDSKNEAIEKIQIDLTEYLKTDGYDEALFCKIGDIVEKAVKYEVTKMIIEKEQRLDGRKINEIRQLEIEAGLLHRTHGSGLFSRGETQVLSIVTLGSPRDEQILDTMESDCKKNYMHHYNFPPFSVGEARPMRGTSRREIGHGALAEKALLPVLPEKEDFPYTIRVVSEVLGSNGSSSMGSTCGSSLSLMDAGVPIKKQVGGIAMGLASDKSGRWKVITDLQDVEDGDGGMDFKLTGTKDGITAIQMDTKTDGITAEIIEQTFKQGLEARLGVLDKMNSVISAPRTEMSPYAPRIVSFMIKPDKIGAVIGPGGKMINAIIAETGADIDIEDSGLVVVCSDNPEGSAKAVDWIKNLTKEVEPGEEYEGKVTRIMDFGAFVEVLPKQEGLVHVSELAPYRVNHPSDIVNEGDIISVKVMEIDKMGRINLSHKQTAQGMERKMPPNYEQSDRQSSPRFNNNDRNDRFSGRKRF
ncbi:polyribonucleotide nucleotidyltransferase [Patescibacteria group bacterium]